MKLETLSAPYPPEVEANIEHNMARVAYWSTSKVDHIVGSLRSRSRGHEL